MWWWPCRLLSFVRDPRYTAAAAPASTGSASRTCASTAARTRARPRCSSTRWLPALHPSASHTSAPSQPSTSRSRTTSRCAGGSSSIAAVTAASVSSRLHLLLGPRLGRDRPAARPAVVVRKNALGVGRRGSSAARSRASAENGTLRPLAHGARASPVGDDPYSHVRSSARPFEALARRSRPPATPPARRPRRPPGSARTCRAWRSSAAPWRATSSANARSSPARSPASSSASGSAVRRAASVLATLTAPRGVRRYESLTGRRKRVARARETRRGAWSSASSTSSSSRRSRSARRSRSGSCRACAMPAVVAEIALGIAVGPHGLGWVEIDEPVEIVSLLGLAFLLFLAGLELDVRTAARRAPAPGGGGLRRRASCSALVVGYGMKLGGLADAPMLIAVALVATSLGVVVPVLKDAGEAGSELGQLVIAAASIADFGAIILLSVFFTGEEGSASVAAHPHRPVRGARRARRAEPVDGGALVAPARRAARAHGHDRADPRARRVAAARRDGRAGGRARARADPRRVRGGRDAGDRRPRRRDDPPAAAHSSSRRRATGSSSRRSSSSAGCASTSAR